MIRTTQTTTKGVSLSSTGPWSGERRKTDQRRPKERLAEHSGFRPLEERLTNVRISALAESLIGQFRTFGPLCEDFASDSVLKRGLPSPTVPKDFFDALKRFSNSTPFWLNLIYWIFCQLTVLSFYDCLSVDIFRVFNDFRGKPYLVVNGFSGSGVWVRVELSLLKWPWHWTNEGSGDWISDAGG